MVPTSPQRSEEDTVVSVSLFVFAAMFGMRWQGISTSRKSEDNVRRHCLSVMHLLSSCSAVGIVRVWAACGGRIGICLHNVDAKPTLTAPLGHYRSYHRLETLH
eukprot:scaffold1485_cov171-Amphora_coffeaeformis.AAC.13